MHLHLGDPNAEGWGLEPSWPVPLSFPISHFLWTDTWVLAMLQESSQQASTWLTGGSHSGRVSSRPPSVTESPPREGLVPSGHFNAEKRAYLRQLNFQNLRWNRAGGWGLWCSGLPPKGLWHQLARPVLREHSPDLSPSAILSQQLKAAQSASGPGHGKSVSPTHPGHAQSWNPDWGDGPPSKGWEKEYVWVSLVEGDPSPQNRVALPEASRAQGTRSDSRGPRWDAAF